MTIKTSYSSLYTVRYHHIGLSFSPSLSNGLSLISILKKWKSSNIERSHSCFFSVIDCSLLFIFFYLHVIYNVHFPFRFRSIRTNIDRHSTSCHFFLFLFISMNVCLYIYINRNSKKVNKKTTRKFLWWLIERVTDGLLIDWIGFEYYQFWRERNQLYLSSRNVEEYIKKSEDMPIFVHLSGEELT